MCIRDSLYFLVSLFIFRLRKIQRYDPRSYPCLLYTSSELNIDKTIHGIIIQLPTPGTEITPLLDIVTPEKDVDGLTSKNLGLIWHNKLTEIMGATPKAILFALSYICLLYTSLMILYLVPTLSLQSQSKKKKFLRIS